MVQLLIFESEEDPENIIAEEINQEVEPAEINEPQITYYALTRWSGPQTMRVKAKIRFYEIMVLIDSNSTHNFISTRLANLLQLPIETTAAFTVRVANGDKLTCRGKFKKVQILIQEIPFSLTVYAFANIRSRIGFRHPVVGIIRNGKM